MLFRSAEKYKQIEQSEVRFETVDTDDCSVLFVAYGTPSRIVLSVIDMLKDEGIKAGLFRPISLWPFPYEQLRKVSEQASIKAVVCVELSMGQMIDDVKIAVMDKKPIGFCGTAGGVVVTQQEIIDVAKATLGR